MRSNLGVAAFIAVAAGAAGVGAMDSVPNLYGSEGLRQLTQSVLSQCVALHGLGDPIAFRGAGSTLAEWGFARTAPTQLIAPMSRPMGPGICSTSSHHDAEGLVLGLNAVSVVVNNSNGGPEGIDFIGEPGATENPWLWRDVLQLIYTGTNGASNANIFSRDCDGPARRLLVNNWDSVFHGTASECTDSHPSIAGSGANGYDQSNSIVEPGIRHAFRRDEGADATDVFLRQLGLPPINFAQTAPAGSNASQTAVYRGLANSPFCNVKRPEDKWPPVTLPANPVLGFSAS